MQLYRFNGDYLTVHQASKILKVSETTIKQLILKNSLKGAYKLNELWLIPVEAFSNTLIPNNETHNLKGIYLTATDAAKLMDMRNSWISFLIKHNRIPGAIKVQKYWLIPYNEKTGEVIILPP